TRQRWEKDMRGTAILMSLGVLLGIPACSDTNSPNTTGQSQPTTMGQQAPNTTVKQTPSAEPQHPTTTGQGPGPATVGVAPPASAQDPRGTADTTAMCKRHPKHRRQEQDLGNATKPTGEEQRHDHRPAAVDPKEGADTPKLNAAPHTAGRQEQRQGDAAHRA